MHPFRRLLPAATLLIVISGIGIAGYSAIEGWTLLEGAYMVVITLFTIGFEEVHQLSPAGMVFTIVLVISGVGTAVYIAGQAVEIIVEGEIFGYQRKKRMDKEIAGMKSHYIICGFGRVGHEVAQAFQASKVHFLVIDPKPATAEELEFQSVPHIIGDATSDITLMRAGIERAKGLVACSDSDVANVYVTLSARALNPNLFIAARAGFRDTEKKLTTAGANRVISPYFIAGRRMAAMATHPVTCDFLDLVTITADRSNSACTKSRSRLTRPSIPRALAKPISAARPAPPYWQSAGRMAPSIFSRIPLRRSGAATFLVVLGTLEQAERLEKRIL